MSVNLQPSPWDGQVFRGDRIAVQLAQGSTAVGSPQVTVVGALATQAHFVLPNQLRQFLNCHQDKLLVCVNAAEFHWAAWRILSKVADHEGLRTLWRFSEQLKLADLSLLQELLVLAGSETVSNSPAPGGPDEARLLDPSQVLDQFDRLYDLALELSRGARIDDETIACYGPLGLGIQVKGAIALHRTNRATLRINVPRRAEVALEFERLWNEAAQAVERDRTLRQCYRPAKGPIGFHEDVPKVHYDRLREWLNDRLADGVNFEGGPIPGPNESDGRLSLAPEAWGILRRYDRRTGTWAHFALVSNSLQFLRRTESIRVEYITLPRVQLRPAADLLESLLGKGMIEPGDGKQFIVGEFIDLELRAFAFYCHQTYAQSQLADLIDQAPDAIRAVATFLRSQPEFYRLLPASVISHDNHLQKVTSALLTAVAYKLSCQHVYEMLRDDIGIAISRSDIDHLHQVVVELLPEARAHLEADSCLTLISNNLHVDFTACQNPFDGYDKRRICRAIHGQSEFNGFPILKQLNQDPRLVEPLDQMRGSAELASLILSRSRSTPTGRVRHQAPYSEDVAEHLDLVDDVIKSVAYALVKDGANLVALINGKWAVETSADDGESECRRLSLLASEAAGQILRGFHLPASSELKRVW